MLSFEASFYDGRSAQRQQVRVEASGQSIVVKNLEGQVLDVFSVEQLHYDPPLGRQPRVIHLTEGRQLQTLDYSAFKQLSARRLSGRLGRWIAHVESKFAWIFISLILVALSVFGLFRFGVPALAYVMAQLTPNGILEQASDRAMEQLDQRWFEASSIDHAVRDFWRAELRAMVGTLEDPSYAYRLYFRDSEVLGANALALPDGALIVTDDLIDLLQSDDELRAVLWHEIGHVEEQHGLRQVYQSLGALAVITVLLGDLTIISDIAIALPAILISNGYSHQFEREADLFAAEALLERGGSVEPLISILERLGEDTGGDLGWLSTHPHHEVRAAYLRAFVEQEAQRM